MRIQPFQTVGQIAVYLPGAAAIFDKYKIDYFSQGNHNLNDACYLAGVPMGEVLRELEEASTASGEWYEREPDWENAPMAEVVGHVLKVHHVYTRDQLDRIEKLLEDLGKAGGPLGPEISFLREFFPHMAHDLRDHMREEEEVVFPYLLDAERALERGAPIPRPFQGFNALTHPILTLQADHGMMSREWIKIREMTRGFTANPGAGKPLKELYQALKDLESDNRKHMHLENNVLFHRAIQLGLLNGEEKNEGHHQKTSHL